MVRINENFNTSVLTQLALQGAKFVEWLSEQFAALCALASRIMWKGSAEPAPSLEGRVVELWPLRNDGQTAPEAPKYVAEPATPLTDRVEVLSPVRNDGQTAPEVPKFVAEPSRSSADSSSDSSLKLRKIIELLKAAQKDPRKLRQFDSEITELPLSIREQFTTKYQEIVGARKLAGLDRDASIYSPSIVDIAVKIIAFEEIIGGF